MMEEDQTIELRRDEETRDFILSGMGQQHIEIIVEKLKRKYGAEVVLKAPKVPYKETIRASASGAVRPAFSAIWLASSKAPWASRSMTSSSNLPCWTTTPDEFTKRWL